MIKSALLQNDVLPVPLLGLVAASATVALRVRLVFQTVSRPCCEYTRETVN